jgi:uncharacterized protein (DUF1697 family)
LHARLVERLVTTHVALLRAINVGGQRKVAMADLRELCARIGFPDALTLLQSGNLVLRAGSKSAARLERLLETEVAKGLGLETDIFVRTAAEWREIIAANPHPAEAERDPGHLVLMCLKASPPADRVAALQAAIRGREVVRAAGRHAYIVYPDGIGTSRLTVALIERKLGTRGTGRNWNTVLRLADVLSGA